jgi:PAS domain S-box-containing protein
LTESARTNKTGDPFDVEYRIIGADGGVVWLHDHAFLATAPDGRRAWQGVLTDITEHKEAEQQLKSTEERFRAIVEHMPSAIYLDVPDSSLRTLYVSPQIEDITGISPADWTSRPEAWLEAIDPADKESVIERYSASIADREPWSGEYRIRTRDGRTIWVRDETTFLDSGQDGQASMLGVISDITERKLAEQALRESEQREREAAERLRALDEMKNTFLAAVSHELRSPLTSILGLSLTLERTHDMPVEDRDDLLERLASNARKLDRLLKDLLDIDRLNRGIVEPQYRVVDIGALARRTVETLDSLTDRKVIVKVESVTIAADPAKVERIVENLLINAARHTASDRKIWLLVKASEDGVLVTVEDNGKGVPEEIRGEIFEPFRQGPTASPHSPGTGIGLSLVARFAELHGGRAWVQDRAGGGASFRVFLPAGPLPAAAKTPTQVPAKAAAPRRSGTAVAKTTVRSGGKAAAARNGRRSTRTPAKDPEEASLPTPSGPPAG